MIHDDDYIVLSRGSQCTRQKATKKYLSRLVVEPRDTSVDDCIIFHTSLE